MKFLCQTGSCHVMSAGSHSLAQIRHVTDITMTWKGTAHIVRERSNMRFCYYRLKQIGSAVSPFANVKGRSRYTCRWQLFKMGVDMLANEEGICVGFPYRRIIMHPTIDHP